MAAIIETSSTFEPNENASCHSSPRHSPSPAAEVLTAEPIAAEPVSVTPLVQEVMEPVAKHSDDEQPEVIVEEEIVEDIVIEDDASCDKELEELETEELETEELEEYEERNEEFVCHVCDELFTDPKVLTCLHVFCKECLEKHVEPVTPDEADPTQSNVIVCTVCSQETHVGVKGAAELMSDNVMVNMQDMEAIKKMKVICTSCKANEKAVARCSDCANFLCPNCVTAHKYMRCFENHKVVPFEEMGPGFKLHKPLFCSNHPTESLKYFCQTCQIPLCTECMVIKHRSPEHQCERIEDPDDNMIKNQVSALVTEAKSKVDYCEKASANLENSLAELQMERDDSRSLIEETFQTYKAVLEEQKSMMMTELEDIHNKHRDTILHVFDNVGKTIDKIDDSCKFTERVMDHGNCTEVLLLKRIIFTQLMSLINNTPKADVNVTINFETNIDKFKKAVVSSFGSFRREPLIKGENHALAHLQSSFEAEGITLPNTLRPVATVMMSPSTELTQGLASLAMTSMAPSQSGMSGVSPQTINSIASSIQSLTGALQSSSSTTVERSGSRNSNCSPAMSDSGISVDAASNGSTSNHAMVTYTALSKLGSVNANSTGQVLLNGTAIPGLYVNNVSGFPPSRVSPVSALALGSDPALASLLGGMSSSVSVTARPTTPLGDMSSMLGVQGGPPSLTTQFSNPMAGLQMPSPTGEYHIHNHPPVPPRSTGKVSPMQIRCKFGQLGPGKGQFNSPHGFCLGMDEDIVVADTNNHRVQVFEKMGAFKYHFGIPGREEGQLWYPRKVAVIRVSGKYVVCDRGNERSRMQIFTKNGHFIKKIAIRYIDIVAGLAISQAGHIVAVDSVSPTVFVISEGGDLVKWFDCSDYMREPSDIAVSGREYFVCDFKGHCVVVFNEDGQFLRRVGCENITNFPNGIDISDAGDVLVGDSHGNRFHVGVFQRDGSLIGEFECPYVKVSRCCGLKITSEGYLVTLAKNNHHVLVLNTLYIS